MVASGQDEARRLILDEAAAYWLSSGADSSVVRLRFGGGPPETIAAHQKNAVDLALSGADLYWTTFGTPNGTLGSLFDGTVMRAPTSGGEPAVIAEGLPDPAGIAADAASVYWTLINSNPIGAIQKAGHDGSDLMILATMNTFPWRLVVAESTLYFIASGHDIESKSGSVQSIGTSGGSSTTLASGQAGPVDMAVDAHNVYWVNTGGYVELGGPLEEGAGTVMMAPRSGGQPEALAIGQDAPVDLAIDDRCVFWVNRGTPPDFRDGAVMGVPIEGGPTITVIADLVAPTSIAVSTTSIYWTSGDGAVSRRDR